MYEMKGYTFSEMKGYTFSFPITGRRRHFFSQFQ